MHLHLRLYGDSLLGRVLLCVMIKWTKVKIHLYSGSVSCLMKIFDYSGATEKWKNQIKVSQQFNEYAELSGIDGHPIEFDRIFFRIMIE